MDKRVLTVAEIFDAFGGPASFGRIVGVTTRHAAAMRARDSIPSKYWPRVIEAARARRIAGVTLDNLAAAKRG